MLKVNVKGKSKCNEIKMVEKYCYFKNHQDLINFFEEMFGTEILGKLQTEKID